MNSQRRNKLFEITVFAMFGALMFISKQLMELLPNIHLLGVFTVMLTVVYRVKALIPIYIFVILEGILAGFSMWWVPYIYIWTLLWAATMLLPKNMPKKAAMVIYPIICALHGFLYGTLYAPAQALMFGLDFGGMIAWIIAGLPYDALHGVGNLVGGFLIYPLSVVVKKLDGKYRK